MISNHEEDEFIAVRVQDPRIQNEGSWNSYVDYKIFLHTNSRAFTAKTSCVRRRYSEFAWLKKKLQKNAGLVPVPDLPRKSLFSFSNEDFLEGRRRGLQAFLDKVVHMTVCLSDSQLHLFLQTQLPVGHIQDCVQGHTPYTVTDAILTYASSNQGFAQAQEDDANKESSLTISYESMESPAPHQPCPQTQETLKPEFLSCGDSDLPQGSAPLCDSASVELQQNGKSSLKVPRKNNRVEGCNTPSVSFFLGEGQDESGSLSPSERSCRMQTSAEVHTPMWAGSEVDCGGSGSLEGACSLREEGVATLDTGEHTGARPDAETDQQGDSEEANVESKPETENCVNCVATVDFTNTDIESQVDVLEDECPEMQVLENQVIPDDDDLEHIGGTEGHDADVSCSEEIVNSNMHQEPDEEKGANSESEGEAPPDSKTLEDGNDMHSVPRVETGDAAQPTAQQPAAQEPDLVATKYESDEDSHSPPSSTGSIVRVSDDESACDEAIDLIRAESVYTKTSCEEVLLWSEVEASSRSILDLHLNGSPAEKGGVSTREDGEELQHKADIKNLCNSQDFNSAVADGELTENGDFSILATIRSDGLTDEKCTD